MRSWDGFRYCCEISASELLLKQPGALLHGIDWTADPDDGKASAARIVGSVHSSLSRHFGATRMHDLQNSAGKVRFSKNLMPRLSRWVTP
jgi:hypothetical protein